MTTQVPGTQPQNPAVNLTPAQKPNSTTQQTPPVEKKLEIDHNSAKFAALARREKEVQDMQRAVKAERAAFKAEQDKLKLEMEAARKWQSLPALAREKPLDALKELGLDYDSITKTMINGGQLTPDQIADLKAEQKVSALRKELEDKAKAEKEETLKNGREQFMAAGSQYVRDNAEKYFLLGEASNPGKVIQEVVDEHWNQQKVEEGGFKKRLSIQEAADYIEAYYEDKAKNNPKLRSLFSEVKPSTEPEKDKLVPAGNNPVPPVPSSPAKAFNDAMKTLKNTHQTPPPAVGGELDQYKRPDGSFDMDKWRRRSATFIKI